MYESYVFQILIHDSQQLLMGFDAYPYLSFQDLILLLLPFVESHLNQVDQCLPF